MYITPYNKKKEDTKLTFLRLEGQTLILDVMVYRHAICGFLRKYSCSRLHRVLYVSIVFVSIRAVQVCTNKNPRKKYMLSRFDLLFMWL